MGLLRDVVGRYRRTGRAIDHLDVTVIAETVRVAPVREEIRTSLAEALGLNPEAVSVKATTTDGLGFLGRDEGIAAIAVITGSAGPT